MKMHKRQTAFEFNLKLPYAGVLEIGIGDVLRYILSMQGCGASIYSGDVRNVHLALIVAVQLSHN